MIRTTVYLPHELKRRLEQTAAATGRSEAELIREGIAAALESAPYPPPELPLFKGKPGLAQRVDELLEGFGED